MCASAGLALLAACGGRSGAPAPVTGPALAPYAAQPVVLAPVAVVRVDTLAVVQRLGGARAAARLADSVIVAQLEARGLGRGWVLPADLVRSYERNRTYAANPYQLAVELLRSPRFVTGERYGEPLSTQLRTMIALHENARVVLLPIDLRFEADGAAARGVLKTALLDPRFAHAVWVGEVRGDAAATPAGAVASVASRLVDLFMAP